MRGDVFLMTRARRVDQNQKEIVAALRAAGCRVFCSHAVGAGLPDLLVWSPYTQRIHLLEVKSIKGHVTKKQILFFVEWADAADAGLLTAPRSVDEALRNVGANLTDESG